MKNGMELMRITKNYNPSDIFLGLNDSPRFFQSFLTTSFRPGFLKVAAG